MLEMALPCSVICSLRPPIDDLIARMSSECSINSLLTACVLRALLSSDEKRSIDVSQTEARGVCLTSWEEEGEAVGGRDGVVI